MKYFQSDDIPVCEPKKDCIHRYYRIVIDGKIIKEGRHALKQTRNIENRIIYKRKWNESKRCLIFSTLKNKLKISLKKFANSK